MWTFEPYDLYGNQEPVDDPFIPVESVFEDAEDVTPANLYIELAFRAISDLNANTDDLDAAAMFVTARTRIRRAVSIERRLQAQVDESVFPDSLTADGYALLAFYRELHAADPVHAASEARMDAGVLNTGEPSEYPDPDDLTTEVDGVTVDLSAGTQAA